MLLRALNAAFENGTPSNELALTGVMLHQFDGTTDYDAPWMPCPTSQWCHDVGDRLSVSIVSKRLPFLYKDGGAGMILSPSATHVRCSYFADGGTMSKKCVSTMNGCVAGCCDQWGYPNWCEDVRLESQTVYQCAFKADDLGAMLRHQTLRAEGRHYNEVVVDTAHWDPMKSFVAFYFVEGAKQPALDAHSKFHALYGIDSVNAAPLVQLQLQPEPGQPYFVRVK